MKENNNINNKPPLRDRNRFNDFLTTNLDATIENRYCRNCNVRLVHNPRNSSHDKYIYSCPICNCTLNISNTQPEEKIMVTFPTTHNAQSFSNNKKLIVQSDSQRLSRSQYFINKRIQEKNEMEGNEDPYLKILKQRSNIRITNVEYYDAAADYEE